MSEEAVSEGYRCGLLLMATIALVAAGLPAAAKPDCAELNRYVLKTDELRKRVLHEVERVKTLKMEPGLTDTGLCHASYELVTYTNALKLFIDPACFENRTQMDSFAGEVQTLRQEAVSLMQNFCSDADLKR